MTRWILTDLATLVALALFVALILQLGG